MNGIRLLVDNARDIEVSTDNFQAGQELFITQGPLTGLSCEMIKSKGYRKLLVRVNLLQRNLLVMLPSDHFMATSSLGIREPK